MWKDDGGTFMEAKVVSSCFSSTLKHLFLVLRHILKFCHQIFNVQDFFYYCEDSKFIILCFYFIHVIYKMATFAHRWDLSKERSIFTKSECLSLHGIDSIEKKKIQYSVYNPLLDSHHLVNKVVQGPLKLVYIIKCIYVQMCECACVCVCLQHKKICRIFMSTVPQIVTKQ